MENKSVKKKNMSGKKIVALCAVLVAIICVVFIVLINGGNGTNKVDNKGLEEIYPEEMKSFTTETDYCVVKYPEKWEDNTRVEVENNDFETIVKYYGTVGKHAEQLLFEVCFGGAGEIPVGIITVDDVSTDVGITYAELDVKDWSEEDANTIYAMQEDVNYIIMQLEKENNFERVE